MAYENPPFVVRRGDDRLIEFQIYDVDGRPSVLDGAQILISYGHDPGRYTAVNSRTQADPDVLIYTGKILLRMRPAETLSLNKAKSYWLKVRVVFGDFTDTVAVGSFVVV